MLRMTKIVVVEADGVEIKSTMKSLEKIQVSNSQILLADNPSVDIKVFITIMSFSKRLRCLHSQWHQRTKQ